MNKPLSPPPSSTIAAPAGAAVLLSSSNNTISENDTSHRLLQQQQEQQEQQEQQNASQHQSFSTRLPHDGDSRIMMTEDSLVMAAADEEHDVAQAIITKGHQPQEKQQYHQQAQQEQAQDHPSRITVQEQEHNEKRNVRVDFDYTALGCGLLAGVAQAGLFNPYDRALYLSVRHHRPFLSIENWKAPYTGFLQSITGRALQGGLYFPLEQFFLQVFGDNNSSSSHHHHDHHAMLHFTAGTAAGAVNALILNPLSAIKYKTWGRRPEDHQRRGGGSGGMWKEVARMRQKHAIRLQQQQQSSSSSFGAGGSSTTSFIRTSPFFNGLAPTIYRDVAFGGCYTFLRLQIRQLLRSSNMDDNDDTTATIQWQANFLAAGLATILSGPFNYARNMQYATSSRHEALSTRVILQQLLHETRQQEYPIRFLQQRLRIGWGTARVALGISMGHATYDWLRQQLEVPPVVAASSSPADAASLSSSPSPTSTVPPEQEQEFRATSSVLARHASRL